MTERNTADHSKSKERSPQPELAYGGKAGPELAYRFERFPEV
jgi:hypothetical protein